MSEKLKQEEDLERRRRLINYIQRTVRMVIRIRVISEAFLSGDDYLYLIKNLQTEIVRKNYNPYEVYLNFKKVTRFRVVQDILKFHPTRRNNFTIPILRDYFRSIPEINGFINDYQGQFNEDAFFKNLTGKKMREGEMIYDLKDDQDKMYILLKGRAMRVEPFAGKLKSLHNMDQDKFNKFVQLCDKMYLTYYDNFNSIGIKTSEDIQTLMMRFDLQSLNIIMYIGKLIIIEMLLFSKLLFKKEFDNIKALNLLPGMLYKKPYQEMDLLNQVTMDVNLLCQKALEKKVQYQVYCLSDCIFAIINQEQFDNPVQNMLKDQIQKKSKYIQESYLGNGLNQYEISNLAINAQCKEVLLNQIIYEKSKIDNNIYFLQQLFINSIYFQKALLIFRSGEIQLLDSDNTKISTIIEKTYKTSFTQDKKQMQIIYSRKVITTLAQGQIFGDEILIPSQETKLHTARSTTKSVLLVIKRNILAFYMNPSNPNWNIIEKIILDKINYYQKNVNRNSIIMKDQKKVQEQGILDNLSNYENFFQTKNQIIKMSKRISVQQETDVFYKSQQNFQSQVKNSTFRQTFKSTKQANSQSEQFLTSGFSQANLTSRGNKKKTFFEKIRQHNFLNNQLNQMMIKEDFNDEDCETLLNLPLRNFHRIKTQKQIFLIRYNGEQFKTINEIGMATIFMNNKNKFLKQSAINPGTKKEFFDSINYKLKQNSVQNDLKVMKQSSALRKERQIQLKDENNQITSQLYLFLLRKQQRLQVQISKRSLLLPPQTSRH